MTLSEPTVEAIPTKTKSFDHWTTYTKVNTQVGLLARGPYFFNIMGEFAIFVLTLSAHKLFADFFILANFSLFSRFVKNKIGAAVVGWNKEVFNSIANKQFIASDLC